MDEKKEAAFAFIDELIDRDVDMFDLSGSLPKNEYDSVRKRLSRTFGSVKQALIEYGFYETSGTPSETELFRCFSTNDKYEVEVNEFRKVDLVEVYRLSNIEFIRLSKPVIKSLKMDAIDQFYREHFPFDGMSYQTLQNNNRQLISYIMTYYGTFKRFLAAYRTPYDTFVDRECGSNKIRAGNVFESKLGEILSVIHGGNNVKTDFRVEDCRPDFVIGRNWVDAKLSVDFVYDARCKTVEKYVPHCDSLTIYYAIGRVKTEVVDGAKITHVSELYEDLRRVWREDLVIEMEAFIRHYGKEVSA